MEELEQPCLCQICPNCPLHFPATVVPFRNFHQNKISTGVPYTLSHITLTACTSKLQGKVPKGSPLKNPL